MIDAAGLANVAALLRDVARTEIMPRFRRLGVGGIRTKSGPLDLVTDADEAAERAITAGLEARYPGCLVVGEEATAADPSLLDRLGAAPLAFVVDPVDGTANFAAGLPLFGCMVAAIVEGAVVASWILDPVGGEIALARAGHGAWIEAAEGSRTPLSVAAPVPLGRMVACVAWGWLPHPDRGRVTGHLPRLAAAPSFRCAAHEYRLAAGGQIHGLFYARLMPWDHAPGWLLHQEAGGYAARFDGSPYRPGSTTGGLIAAPDQASWQALRDGLLGE